MLSMGLFCVMGVFCIIPSRITSLPKNKSELAPMSIGSVLFFCSRFLSFLSPMGSVPYTAVFNSSLLSTVVIFKVLAAVVCT